MKLKKELGKQILDNSKDHKGISLKLLNQSFPTTPQEKLDKETTEIKDQTSQIRNKLTVDSPFKSEYSASKSFCKKFVIVRDVDKI
jgi:hypothetical protein